MDRRISAMAAVQEQIYRSDQYENVDAADYVGQIAKNLKESYGSAAALDLRLTTTIVSRDHAVPLALITNELVSNAFKYAFAEGETGRIEISLGPDAAGHAVLEVKDNGKGFVPDAASKGIGRRLIVALAGQLDATFEYLPGSGTAFRLQFPLVDPRAAST